MRNIEIEVIKNLRGGKLEFIYEFKEIDVHW